MASEKWRFKISEFPAEFISPFSMTEDRSASAALRQQRTVSRGQENTLVTTIYEEGVPSSTGMANISIVTVSMPEKNFYCI